MKKLPAFLMSLLVGYALHAQEHYVEVVVTDTMIVEPTEWNYFLFLQKRPEKEANAPIGVVQKSDRAALLIRCGRWPLPTAAK